MPYPDPALEARWADALHWLHAHLGRLVQINAHALLRRDSESVTLQDPCVSVVAALESVREEPPGYWEVMTAEPAGAGLELRRVQQLTVTDLGVYALTDGMGISILAVPDEDEWRAAEHPGPDCELAR